VASPMGDEDEDKADPGYGAILDRDGDVGRVNMRIPFQLGLGVALDVLSDFIFSPVILATLAQADSTGQREQTGTEPRCSQAETP
jgi:hypothetical protein